MLPLVHPFYWGMWFVAAPLLIHLINMLRHQRVEWAAMEFLLASQKKHQTWVILKQLLLLLLRMAAIAMVVLALAQPLLPDRWGSFLGAQPTHHIVLLDDSYSMSEDLGGLTAFDQAKKAISRLGDSVVRPREPQTFTLLRLSRCGGRYGGTRPDFQKEPVDADFAKRLANTLESIEVSQTAAEPLPAFEAMQQLLGEDFGERRVVYLLTDFRTRQWDKPDDLKTRLAQLDENRTEIRLIDCVEESGRPNLAISSLEPEEGIRAAGVQWRMQVTVQNYGPSAVRNVPVYWSADGKPGGSVAIHEILPGRAAQKEFDVNFAVAGEHLIEANLNADAVNIDNQRYAVVDLPVATPVLLVDGQRSASNSRPIALALTVRKGIQPEIVAPDYLSAPKRPLGDFAMICVANVGRIERSGVEALEKYVAEGGGVLFVTGPLTRGDHVTRDWYRNGKGLFPVPLAGPEPLLVDPLDNTPDVHSEDHYVFHNMDHRVENISKIFVQQYFATPAGWKPKSDPSLREIMRLRNGAPLLVEKNFGRGRVLAFLSTTSDKWNNWLRGSPSFVAFVFNIVPYLSHRFGAGEALLVGEPKAVTFNAPPFEPAVHFSGPAGDDSAATINAEASGSERRTVTYTKTETAGFYKALFTQPSHKTEARYFAVNVDPAEGDLRALTGPDLASRLAPLKYEFEYASSYKSKLDETQGRNLGDLFLLILLIVLIVEQMFAWSCSYHVSSRMTDPWSPGSQSRQVENLSYPGAKGGPA
ncbi:MAG: BatA domain-containing protein [Thermoguttaceae bacterium]